MKALYLASLPLIGAVIGWLTNWVAVKLIFRPHRPVTILGYSIQGVVPKRRAELARSIGQVVERELISVDDLIGAVRSRETMDRISAAAAVSIKNRIMDRLPAFVPLSVKKAVSSVITDQIRMEIPAVITEMFDRFGVLMKEKVNFQSMVEEKVNNFSLDRLEQIILSVSARELKHIELLGGVLGFLIGLVQAGLAYAAGYR
ncbi:MAG: DUF445 family protein [Peptococcaceae bacterium]|nr:DUF445 family protein [Peptococcaceae bacterium]